MSKSIRDKERYYFKKWTYLQALLKEKNIEKEKSYELIEAEDEAYKKWLFFKGFLNAKEGVENEKSKKIK